MCLSFLSSLILGWLHRRCTICNGLKCESSRCPRIISPLGMSIFLIMLFLITPSNAQTEEQAPPPPCKEEVRLPLVPLREPRPAQGTTADQQWQTVRQGQEQNPTASFIDTLKGNDAAIEVILGQGRLLTLKSDIGEKREGAIAVGNPNIVQFNVLSKRSIRLLGTKPGTTDLSIIDKAGQIYTYEIRVIYDLELLRARLHQSFPDTYLKLGQLGEKLVVEGQARSPRTSFPDYKDH